MSTTDDTRQRTIAEIIGWERGGFTVGPYRDHVRTDGTICIPTDEPQVDDMLAWLRERVVTNGLHFYVNTLDTYTVTAWMTGDDHRSGHAPTLHAALEAAVRAVAEVKRQ